MTIDCALHAGLPAPLVPVSREDNHDVVRRRPAGFGNESAGEGGGDVGERDFDLVGDSRAEVERLVSQAVTLLREGRAEGVAGVGVERRSPCSRAAQ